MAASKSENLSGREIYKQIHDEVKTFRQSLVERYRAHGDQRKTIAEALEWQGQKIVRELEEEARRAREEVRKSNGATQPLR